MRRREEEWGVKYLLVVVVVVVLTSDSDSRGESSNEPSEMNIPVAGESTWVTMEMR